MSALIRTREAVVMQRNYFFSLTDEDDFYSCGVHDGVMNFALWFIYDEAMPSRRHDARVKQRFDADIDALIAAGGTREAMARFVFGNVMEQEEQ